MSEGKKKPELIKFVNPADSKAGDQHGFGNLRIDLLEVRREKHPWGADTFVIAYQVIDNRVTPVFQSPVAHLFLTTGVCGKCKISDCEHTNVKRALKAVTDHYEQIRESIFNVKFDEPVVKGEMK